MKSWPPRSISGRANPRCTGELSYQLAQPLKLICRCAPVTATRRRAIRTRKASSSGARESLMLLRPLTQSGVKPEGRAGLPGDPRQNGVRHRLERLFGRAASAARFPRYTVCSESLAEIGVTPEENAPLQVRFAVELRARRPRLPWLDRRPDPRWAAAYYVNWKNLQQTILLSCGFGFTANVGSAKSEGFELEASRAVPATAPGSFRRCRLRARPVHHLIERKTRRSRWAHPFTRCPTGPAMLSATHHTSR